VDVQDNRITSAFEPGHGRSKDVARYCLHCVFAPGPTVGTAPLAAFDTPTFVVVHEHDSDVAAIVGFQMRKRVGDFTSARQLHEEKVFVAPECDALARHEGAGLLNRLYYCPLQGTPKTDSLGVCIAPGLLPLPNFCFC
jgi:hypothetical protein